MPIPKVQIVSRIFSPEPAAASFRLSALRDGLARAGARVRVITADAPGEENTDPSITRVRVIRDENGYVRGYVPYLSFDLQAFVHILTQPAPDIYVVEPPPTTGFFSRIAAGIRRRPYVWYAADIWSDAAASTGAPDLIVTVLRQVEKFVIRGAAGVIAVSDDVADRVRQLGGRYVDVAFNGVNTDLFNTEVQKLTPAELVAHGVKEPFFVYAGNASEWHGAEVFARGFERFWQSNPHAQLVFLGRVAVQEIEDIAIRLSDQARDRGIKCEPIVILDNLPPKLAARWQRTAVSALASVKPGAGYDFAYATKVLSALACGTPVIYSGVGLARGDIADNGLGRAVDYAPEAVADAFAHMVDHGEDYSEQRLEGWVRANRSIKRTGTLASAAVLAALERAREQ